MTLRLTENEPPTITAAMPCGPWLSREPILAEEVVLPEPCRPTIRMTTGGIALRSRSDTVPPNISTR